MAELDLFGYRHGGSRVHRLDVRCKLGSLFLLTSAVVAASPAFMGPLSLGAVVLWCGLGLPRRLLGREMRLFLIFLLAVFAVRALATPGERLFHWQWLQVSREGLQAGAVVVWRLVMILVLGLVFVTTTPPFHLKAAVQWLLRPVPLVSGRKAATMVGLMVRFIPVLHQQVRDTQSALAARGGVRTGRFPRQIRYLIWPTMRRIVMAADQLSLAMIARGYQAERTDPELRATAADGVALLVAGATFLAALVI